MQEVMGTYTQFKKALDTELAKTAEGFVRIGYLLKVARDTEVLSESRYSSVAEFAKAEYGLSKDIVSRYIHINDKYSKDGYSEELEDQYKGFGYSKLAEMLTLPDEIADALDPKMTRQQIQEVKKEVKQEEEITPLEVLTEETKQEQQEYNNDLSLFIHQYGYEARENYTKLAKAAVNENFVEKALDIVAPSGVAMLTIRIAGRGRLMLSIKGKDYELQLLDVRDSSRNANFTWQQLQEAIIDVYKDGTEETWEETYKEPFKTKTEHEKVDNEESEEKGEKNGIIDNGTESVQHVEDSRGEDSKKQVTAEETTNQVKQDVGDIQGVEQEPGQQLVKIKAVTEELKDKLFDIWLENVSSEKIEAACKMMSHMRFSERINTTPKKLFLLVQTSEVFTEEFAENGVELTRVETEKYTGVFTKADFRKRFSKNYLEQYKSRQEETQEEVAPVQQEESTGQQEEQIPGQAVIEDYPETLPGDAVERGYKAAITNNLKALERIWESTDENKIKIMLEKIEDLKWRLEKLQKVEQ